MQKSIKIAVDAMGGDGSPKKVIDGIIHHYKNNPDVFYKIFVKANCLLTDSRTAELSKLVENSSRDVNIAFANELSLICDKLEISASKRVNDLTEEQVLKIREFIDANHKVEGDLRRDVSVNIKRLVDLACYRGSRHKKKLPVRGQRTQCNARTRKGKAIAIAGKKLTPLKK